MDDYLASWPADEAEAFAHALGRFSREAMAVAATPPAPSPSPAPVPADPTPSAARSR